MSATRFLFAMFQGGGNIALLLPIVERLVERGHDVRVLAGPGIWASRMPVSARFLGRIDSAGARCVLLQPPKTHPLDGVHRLRTVHPYSAYTSAYRWSPVWATNVASELDRSPANVVAADHLLPGALAAAEARRIPSVALVHGMYKHRSAPGLPPPGMGFLPARGPVGVARDAVYKAMMEYLYRRDALPSLNVARKQLGLPPLRSAFQQYDRAARVLILCSPELDFRSFHLPSNVRYVGTPLDDFHAPAWTGPWPRDDNRPLVLASLSTLAQGQTDLMQRVLTALGSLRVRALATLGPSLDPSQFQAPANVIVEPFVPHSAVLPNADAMVSQCGIGTLMKALAYGVPLVCLPLIGDQPDNAARVVARGAGIRLGKDASPAQIARAVEHVLSVRTLRDNARRLGSLLDCENAVTRAVNELEWAADGMTNPRDDSRCELVHRRVAALGAKM